MGNDEAYGERNLLEHIKQMYYLPPTKVVLNLFKFECIRILHNRSPKKRFRARDFFFCYST
jgi:hypothetical protein